MSNNNIWVRCEADHEDGGVCMTRHYAWVECRNASEHVGASA